MKRKTYLKPILLKFIVTVELFMDGKFRWLACVFRVKLKGISIQAEQKNIAKNNAELFPILT